MRTLVLLVFLTVLVALTGCAAAVRGTPVGSHARPVPSRPAEPRSESSAAREGKPKVGKASYYARKFHGRSTASGRAYDENELTAAHRSLPFGTSVRVTNLANQKSVVVRVIDRGPFVRGRIIDVSRAAAAQLGFLNKGVTTVRLEPLAR